MFGKILDIAASAMSANRLRINTIASNIANAQTTRTAEGGPYRRRDVVFTAKDVGSTHGFTSELDKASLKGVGVAGVIADPSPPKLVYDPGNPDADKTTGLVAMPNVNPVTEMVNMMSASNAYKAAAEIATDTKEIAQSVSKISSGN